MVDYCENRLIKAISGVGDWLKERKVPVYSCRFSKKTYTQHQLLQGLVVKTLFRLRYRELVELMQIADSLTHSMGLSSIPHFTTFQKFAARFPCRILYQLIHAVAKHICQGTLHLSIDSTGFSLDTSSYHYSRRIRRQERHRSYVKTTMVIDTRTQAVVSVKPRLKLRHDMIDAQPELQKAAKLGQVKTVVADKGYDSEQLLHYIKWELGAKPAISLKYQDKPLNKTHGRLRQNLKRYFPLKRYHQRSKSETVNSRIKRMFDSTIYARTNHTKRNETLLKVLTHNLTLNRLTQDFYRANIWFY
jgi:transposase